MSSNPPQSATPASASKRSPQIAILIAIIAVLVLIIGFLVADRGRLQAQLQDAQSATTSASSPSANQSTETQTSAAGTAATATTDGNVLKLIREQVRRDSNDGHALGNTDAKVVMVLYSDFSCPVCTYFAQSIQPQLADLVADGTLRIEWRDLAQITETSPLAAQAGIAAAEQGKFWDFHDVVYGSADPNDHPQYTEDLLMTYAQQAGITDLDKFKATMTSVETAATVQKDLQYAHSIGIQGTPFMIIGDAVMSGLSKNPVADIRATITAQADNPDAP